METEMEQIGEELILEWMDVAASVFAAEDRIAYKWSPVLRKAKSMPKDEKRALCDDYLRAIAVEIINTNLKESADS